MTRPVRTFGEALAKEQVQQNPVTEPNPAMAGQNPKRPLHSSWFPNGYSIFENALSNPIRHAGSSSGGGERIRKSIDYMACHLNQPLQAINLAAVANLSLSHYFVLFKRATGISPIDFFIRLKMMRARQLLETSSLNISQIADELGYSDPFYFSRTFKAVNGVAPKHYREGHQFQCQTSRSVPGLIAVSGLDHRPG